MSVGPDERARTQRHVADDDIDLVNGKASDEPVVSILRAHQPQPFVSDQGRSKKLCGDQLRDHVSEPDDEPRSAYDPGCERGGGQLMPQRRDLVGITKNASPALRELEPASDSGEEIEIEAGLEPLELLADRRLGEAQFRAAAETPPS